MKKITRNIISVMFGAIVCLVLISCGRSNVPEDIWGNATYTENTEIGSGEKTILVEVSAEEKSVEFTVHSDKETLGDVLSEHDLISGDQGAYGLYVKEVNGIYADYNITKSYWAINKDGEALMTGVDSAEIQDGDSYEFVYTKN